MTTATDISATVREPALLGQTVLVIGGSAGIGLATAHLARAVGAQVVLTGRDPQRLERVAADLGARGYDAFDAHDPRSLDGFFQSLTAPVDHVMVTAGGGVHDQAARDVVRGVERAGPVGILGVIAQHLRTEPDVPVDCPRVGVEQQLSRG